MAVQGVSLTSIAFYDPLEKVKDIGVFEHNDPGKRADPSFSNLLKDQSKVVDLSPNIGTEIHGVQLSKLSSSGLDELALLTAQRGALVFRNQDFAGIGFDAQRKIASHFGPLHVHGWAPHPSGGSQEHMVSTQGTMALIVAHTRRSYMTIKMTSASDVRGKVAVQSSGIQTRVRSNNHRERVSFVCWSHLKRPEGTL